MVGDLATERIERKRAVLVGLSVTTVGIAIYLAGLALIENDLFNYWANGFEDGMNLALIGIVVEAVGLYVLRRRLVYSLITSVAMAVIILVLISFAPIY